MAVVQLGPQAGGFVFAETSIRFLATAPSNQLGPLIRYDVVRLPDGQTRVFLGVANAQPAFNGGRVALFRGTSVIDSDPVEIR